MESGNRVSPSLQKVNKVQMKNKALAYLRTKKKGIACLHHIQFF